MATSYYQTAPAGARLFRAGPFPDIQFSHLTRETAEADAKKLQAYVGAKWPVKQPSKDKLRKAGIL